MTPENPPHYVSLILYGILATPPNFWWQQTIEEWFPGYTVKKVEVDDGGKGVEVQKALNVKNTVIKVILDQTVAALPNVIGYIGVTRLLRGVPLDLCIEAVKEVRKQRLSRSVASTLIQSAANHSSHDRRLQAMARCECDTTCICACRAEDACR